MEYREKSIPAIARWVECAWSLETAHNICGYPVRPDGCIDILYSAAGRLDVVGAMTSEKRFSMAAGSSAVGVRFRPGMAGAFLAIAAQEITDTTIPLRDVWGRRGQELEARLAESTTLGERHRILITGLGDPHFAPTSTQLAAEAITRARGSIDLEQLIRQTGISERQFRRRLLEETGLSPRRLCRVVRFRHACALANSRNLSWSHIAAEAGYFDQAHLIRDFREFTGSTPMSVFYKTDGERRSKVHA
jgi:AraC-like DNA-binding protein